MSISEQEMIRTLRLQFNFALRPGSIALINTGVHDYLGSRAINGSSSNPKLNSNSIDGDSPTSENLALGCSEASILQA